MAQALPSFVELLASLDLESDENSDVQHYARYPTPPSFASSSPSSLPSSLRPSQTSSGRSLTGPGSAASFATASPSIVISHPSPVDDLTPTRRRSNSNRYNPYAPPHMSSRRRSLPGDLTYYPDNVQKRPDATRASSTSPQMRRASSNESLVRLSTRMAMSGTDQPISALVRRRHHSSPQSPTFPKAVRRSSSPTDSLTQVSLPSLPPLPRISAGTSSPAPPFPDLPNLPPLSSMGHRSPTPPGCADRSSQAALRTPQPSSPDVSEVSSFGYRNNESRGHTAYACPCPS